MKRIIGLILSTLLLLISCSKSDNTDNPPTKEVSVDVTASNLFPAKFENVVFNLNIDNEEEVKNISWMVDDKQIGNSAELNHIFNEEGKFEITVIVTDKNNKEIKKTLEIMVKGTSLRYSLKDFDKNKIWIMGHRGNTYLSNMPENSLEGIRYCISLNGIVNIVEVDPRMTKDGVIVLMHDETVDRTTTGKGKVKDLTYKEIQSFNLKNEKGEPTKYKVPSLYDILIEGRGKIFFDLDIKDIPFNEVYNVVKQAGMIDQVLFYTEKLDILNNLNKYNPQPIMYPQCINKSDIDKLSANKDIRMVQLSLNKAIDTDFPEALVEQGLLWATNILDMKGYNYDSQMLEGNYTGVERLVVKNVNMIQSDYPQILHNFLKDKGKR